MNRYVTIFFLLFMLLIMGAFASMAQNNYGFAMIGWVSLGFCLVFSFQLARKLSAKRAYSLLSVAELAGLIVLTLLFSLNNFHIRIPFSDILASAAALMLVLVYGANLQKAVRTAEAEGRSRFWIVIYYAGIILFLLSFAINTFLPQWTRIASGVAFLLLIAFILGAFLVPGFMKGWADNNALKIINTFRDRSFILASLFFLMSLYGTAVGMGWLPPLYSDDYPKVFFEMNGRQEPGSRVSKKEVSQNDFKVKYERFVDRNLDVKE